jgi:hypothetical protein
MKADQPTAHPDARETIAYAELLKLAHEEGLKSIATSLVLQPSEDNGRLAIVKAAVETERGHFEGLGDADPGNVDDFLVPHLIRVAETRAKARALRDAVNCGVVSFEELDGVAPSRTSIPGSGAPASRTIPLAKFTVPARPRGNAASRPPRSGNGTEPMTEAQRRYLFRIMSGQGYQREAAENRLKEIFEVSALSEITKTAATQMIDELLQTSAPGNGGGNGPASHHQR